jgi:hypothetical protein
LSAPFIIPGGILSPRDLPPGFASLELSQIPAGPGRAVAFRARAVQTGALSAFLDSEPFLSFSSGGHLVGVIGTGAFFGTGEPELVIRVVEAPLWTQPWRFEDSEWSYQQITLTGAAAAIDQESIARERARLQELWTATTPTPLWNRAFQLPIASYLAISSEYGARRSYNGGAYSTYHEGVDFSAYGGTEVYAPADAKTALAEQLHVRGGAVILDHGLGIFTGYYHLSEVHVAAGDLVEAGQLLGRVGSTGLSTGNHLHWDLLVGGTWIDAMAWIEQDMACWILAGLVQNCVD